MRGAACCSVSRGRKGSNGSGCRRSREQHPGSFFDWAWQHSSNARASSLHTLVSMDWVCSCYLMQAFAWVMKNYVRESKTWHADVGVSWAAAAVGGVWWVGGWGCGGGVGLVCGVGWGGVGWVGVGGGGVGGARR